ncbi:MAG: hypothetical protein ACTHJR_08795 [Sphingomonas sp.]|uniref:hypothetical protein n=1 Tax=Sphingomonas sp. TaxID=28214 RepID=UPI003F80CA31
MPRALKVYRTPIGFHDAYVAAPSQKAALEAWGADRNLFARGDAELVTDPKLTKAPLADPGKVIRVARGSAAEHLAAAVPKGGKKAASADKPAKAARKRKPPPRPSRARLNAAEKAIDDLRERQRAASEELRQREEKLEKERRALEKEQAGEIAKLERVRDRAEAAYDRALEKWRLT